MGDNRFTASSDSPIQQGIHHPVLRIIQLLSRYCTSLGESLQSMIDKVLTVPIGFSTDWRGGDHIHELSRLRHNHLGSSDDTPMDEINAHGIALFPVVLCVFKRLLLSGALGVRRAVEVLDVGRVEVEEDVAPVVCVVRIPSENEYPDVLRHEGLAWHFLIVRWVLRCAICCLVLAAGYRVWLGPFDGA